MFLRRKLCRGDNGSLPDEGTGNRRRACPSSSRAPERERPPGGPARMGSPSPARAAIGSMLPRAGARASRRARLGGQPSEPGRPRPTGGVSCPGQSCRQARQVLFVQFSPSPEARKAFLYTSSPIQKPASFLSLSSSSLSDDILSSRLARIKIPITPDMFNP